MQTKTEQIEKKVIHKIMNRAIQINTSCNKVCRDFKIMVSTKHTNTLILRWKTIDISNESNPIQIYRYECFDIDGTPLLCSIYYSNHKEANEFIMSLQPLYHQKFAIDHTLTT